MGAITASSPEIIHAIVGTAGHVDHGKTSLVKLLTGCDTDRLPEEKARGMSIDLGFAPCQLRGRRMVGIVDVPGHKDFIRNMVAGATSIDVLLLVIAADDGVMPQTDEHVKIIRLLRSPQVMVALTKIDMVEPEMLESAKQDVAQFMAKMGYPDAPIIPVSNKTCDGIGDIRSTIDQLVERARQRPADGRAFRMNVERVFAVKGYGTVVTGIPVSGRVGVGGKLELLPGGRPLTVRTIQSYKHDAAEACANCCCAINVRDIEPEGVLRGMTIAAPGIYAPTGEMLVCLENASETETLKRRFVAMLHTGTAVAEASIKLLDAQQLGCGAEAIAHVELGEPITIAAGDRFIIRSASPAATLGGGVVISTRGIRLRRMTDDVLGRLEEASRAAKAGDYLRSALLAGPDAIVKAREVERLGQGERAMGGFLGDGERTFTSGENSLTPAVSQRERDLENLGGGAFAVISRIGEVASRVAGILDRYHRANPYHWGMTPAHVCEELGLEPKSFDRLAKLLAAAGPIAVKHGRLALKSFEPPVSAHLLELRDRILAQVRSAGVNGPARGNLMKELSIVEKDMQVLTALLIEDGTVMFLDGNFILRSVFEECRGKLLELFEKSTCVELGAFRDAINANRKMAVAMLDAFDAEGLTRRVAAGRVLVKRPGGADRHDEQQGGAAGSG